MDPEDILTGQDLVHEIAFYKRTADQNGEPYDPEWDRWLELDARGELWPPPAEVPGAEEHYGDATHNPRIEYPDPGMSDGDA